MLLYPTAQDMLGTLPPVERAKLLILIGEAAAANRREDETAAGDGTT